MNSNNCNNFYISHNNNYSNKSKYRMKRPFGALQNQYPEFYTTSAKKFKYSSHSNDSNINLIAYNSDNKKNAAVFSSFSNDVEMSPQTNPFVTSNLTELQQQDFKKQYLEKIKQEMGNYKTQINKCSSRMKINYECCDN